MATKKPRSRAKKNTVRDDPKVSIEFAGECDCAHHGHLRDYRASIPASQRHRFMCDRSITPGVKSEVPAGSEKAINQEDQNHGLS